MRSGPRVVIVGGGIIGVCCAYYLARRGAEVVLLERSEIGAGASSGNAGTVSAGHPPLNRPGRIQQALRQMTDPTSPLYVKPRLDPGLWKWMLGFARYCTDAHVAHCMRVMAPLGKEALALFDEVIKEEQIECDYRVEGYYDVCSTESGLASARHEAAIIEQYDYHPEFVDGDELRRRDPAFSPQLRGGLFYPEAASLIPAVFLSELAQAAVSAGCEIRLGADVCDVELRGGRAVGVILADGTVVAADAVVLATGPFSLRLARRVGVRLPVQPGKGYHRDIDIGPNGAPNLRVACVLNEASVFCTRMDGYVRFAGTMEFSGENEVMRAARLNQLTHAARSCLPELGTAQPISEWCGLRPMAVDGLPIIGSMGGVEKLTVATGHGMLGLTLGPATGRLIANEVLDGGEGRVEELAPDRFS